MELNSDSFKIRNYEVTQPEGFLKIWITGGIPDYKLEYEGRPSETINADSLFSQASLDTAVGKPLTFNHPPRAITKDNFREHISGAVLQEFAKEPETNALVMSSIVYDGQVSKDIMDGKIKYVSASYSAEKEANNDGVLVQKTRNYNHFAILSPEYEPRAGKASKIIILDDNNRDSQEKETSQTENIVKPAESTPPVEPTIPETPDPNPVVPATPNPTQPLEVTEPTIEPGVKIDTPSTPTPVTAPENPQSDPNTDAMTISKEEIATRVELLTTFKPVLEKAGKAIDYNNDSKAIKKDILSVFYTDATMKQVTDNNLDGFWLGFITTNNDVKEIVGEATKPLTGVNNDSSKSFESVAAQEIAKFTKMLETGKAS